MDVLFQLRFVICKRENGKRVSDTSKEKKLNYFGDSRQVNVDYSVCNGMNFNTSGLREVLLIYDVNCQYLVHFDERLDDVAEYLSRDTDMKLFGAIGKFHLADHVDSCFSKWTLNFMKGSGHIDGEIMETLWSGMNKVSGAARSMSKAHRQETLDDYMRDANWKKTVGISKCFVTISKMIDNSYYFYIVPTLLTKLKRSQTGINSTRPAFDQLTDSCLQRKLPVESWKLAEGLAMEERGDRLKIFDVDHQNAPTLAEITLKLTDTKDNTNESANVVHWISDGIKTQNDQLVHFIISSCSLLISSRSRLRLEISKLPQKPTVKQQLMIARLRARIGKQVKDFLHAASSYLPPLDETDLKAFEDEVIDTPSEESVEPEEAIDGPLYEDFDYEEEEEYEPPLVHPEDTILPLPSNIISVDLKPSLQSLVSVERELRKGQANDNLEGVRIGLANKSLLLLTDVNRSTSTKQSTRAWASVRNAQSQILHHASGYQRAWQALKSIGTAEDLVVYQKLHQKDLVVVKDIAMAKRFGQGSDRLAWFWRIGPSEDALTGKWMEECELTLSLCLYSFN